MSRPGFEPSSPSQPWSNDAEFLSKKLNSFFGCRTSFVDVDVVVVFVDVGDVGVVVDVDPVGGGDNVVAVVLVVMMVLVLMLLFLMVWFSAIVVAFAIGVDVVCWRFWLCWFACWSGFC